MLARRRRPPREIHFGRVMAATLVPTWLLGIPLWVMALHAITLAGVAIFLPSHPGPPSRRADVRRR
jgi:hypothetical protein